MLIISQKQIIFVCAFIFSYHKRGQFVELIIINKMDPGESMQALPGSYNQKQSTTNVEAMNFSSFLKLLKRQIENNANIYENVLPQTYILSMLNETQIRFFNHNQSEETVRMVIEFLNYCKNLWGCQPRLPTTFTSNFPEELALWWQKIKNPVYLANKSHLRILSFILESPKSGRNFYEGHFQHYKMDFSEQSVLKMAQIGIQMARQHTSSFALLSNFLWGSCLNLNDNGVSNEEIIKKYEAVLDRLYNKYRPAPKIWEKNEQIYTHKSFKHKQLIPNLAVDLSGQPNKDQILNNFIMERAAESKSHYNEFYKLMHQVCENNGGFHFKSGLKIKDISQTRALLRIKQKMLKDIYSNEEELSNTIGGQKNRSNTQLGIRELVAEQKRKYEQKMRSLYENMKEPLPFKVSDMLRGKCLFAGVQKINQCCTDIKDALNTEKYKHLKLIEVDNRLGGETSDIVLKILFGNVIAEMQLRINLSDSDYAFAHKLYELKRSKFFSLLTQLSIMNQDLSSSYFTEANAYIKGNIPLEQDDYQQTTTFKEVGEHFGNFINKMPANVDLSIPYEEQVDFSLFGQHLAMFRNLTKAVKSSQTHLQQPQWIIKKHEGEYLYKMHDYSKSYLVLNQAINIMQQKSMQQEEHESYFNLLNIVGELLRQKGDYKRSMQINEKLINQYQKTKVQNLSTSRMFYNIGSVIHNQGNYQKALENYQKCLQIQENIKGKGSIETALTLNSIGLVFDNQGNYEKALQNYQRCLQIQESIKGKGSIDTAVTLSSIGSAFDNLGDYQKAIQNYQRCLQIQEKIKGKGSIDIATTLNNIGLIFDNQGKYQMALQNYKRCLQIQERIKGKGSIDTALLFNNIGSVNHNQGNYEKALQNYQRCLQIQENIKGKGSIDTALTLNNIGFAFDALGNYQKALQNYQRCLQIVQSIKGKGSIDTATILNNIGLAFNNQGKYEKALENYQRCLQIQERIEGKGSIDTATTLSNIGSIRHQQRDHQKALQIFERCLQIEEKIKGRGSIDTAGTIFNIACVHMQKGNYEQSAANFLQSLSIFEHFGHQNTIKKVATSLSKCYSKLNQTDKLQQILKKYDLPAPS